MKAAGVPMRPGWRADVIALAEKLYIRYPGSTPKSCIENAEAFLVHLELYSPPEADGTRVDAGGLRYGDTRR